MESLNKTKLTETQLGRIVRNTFGTSLRRSRELADGWANTAYALTLDDDRTVVLKAAPSKDKRLMRCERNNMSAEVAALALMEEQNVPAPRVLVYDPSCSLLPAEYFIMDYVAGTPLNKIADSLSKQELAGIRQDLGNLSRRINGVKGVSFGYFGEQDGHRGSWPEAFGMMMDDVLADGVDAGVELTVSYAEVTREVDRAIGSLPTVTESSLVHWDLWDGNVLIHEGRINAILDFERALWGEPLIEFYFGRFGRSEAFEQGYGLSVTTPGEHQRRALYDFYLDLILVIECSYRQYADQEHVNWTRRNLMEGFLALQKAGV